MDLRDLNFKIKIHPFPVPIFRCIRSAFIRIRSHDRCESAHSQGSLSIDVQSSYNFTSGISFKRPEVPDTEEQGSLKLRKEVWSC